MDNGTVVCPRNFECDANGSLVSFDIGPIPSYFALLSSTLSVFGSISIVMTYIVSRWSTRTGAQKIITLLAIADFFIASGYVIGSVNFLIHYNQNDPQKCQEFQVICEIQAAVSSWSLLCSFLWTVILAFYFYVVMVHDRTALAAKSLTVYNIIAWGVPLIIVVPVAALRKFGYAPYVGLNWCYIKDTSYSFDWKDQYVTILLVLIVGKLWELISYVVIAALYILMKIHVWKTHQQMRHDFLPPQVGHVEKRLLAIPLLFMFLRIWGTLQFFYSLAVADLNQDGCIPAAVRDLFFVFGILQGIGDGGQGWGNAIIYIFLSPTIRERLFVRPCRKCIARGGRGMEELLENTSEAEITRDRWSAIPADDNSNENSPIAAVRYGAVKYTSTSGVYTESTELTQSQQMSQLLQPINTIGQSETKT